MFAGWGKKFGRIYNFAKSSLFGKIYASFSSKLCSFLGVKFGLKIMLREEELTFSNSGWGLVNSGT